MTRPFTIRLSLALSAALLCASTTFAQQDDDGALKLAEPDFTLIGLPTALRLPKYGSAFRVTHRFTRPLGSGSITLKFVLSRLDSFVGQISNTRFPR